MSVLTCMHAALNYFKLHLQTMVSSGVNAREVLEVEPNTESIGEGVSCSVFFMGLKVEQWGEGLFALWGLFYKF